MSLRPNFKNSMRAKKKLSGHIHFRFILIGMQNKCNDGNISETLGEKKVYINSFMKLKKKCRKQHIVHIVLE